MEAPYIEAHSNQHQRSVSSRNDYISQRERDLDERYAKLVELTSEETRRQQTRTPAYSNNFQSRTSSTSGIQTRTHQDETTLIHELTPNSNLQTSHYLG
jgi:hypothetical protein